MSRNATARDIANKFVMEHKKTYGRVRNTEIEAAIDKIARAIKGVQVAEQKAQRLARTTVLAATTQDR